MAHPYDIPQNLIKPGAESHPENMMNFSMLISARQALEPEPPEEINPKGSPVTNSQRAAWNSYISWLDKKGLKGHPSLDKENKGNDMLAQYIKENPATPLTLNSVIPIQKEFANYRQWSLDSIKAGKGAFAEGTTEENYLKALSIIDGIPGQRTTSFSFPSNYLETFADKKLVSKENLGFATIKK